MPHDVWETAVKIHEGCGGICEWREAINRPGIGYHGYCRRCDTNRLPKEEMIPLEGFDVSDVDGLRTSDAALDELRWRDSESFDENQERFRRELGMWPGKEAV